jgi:acyl-CoA synthetase (AMP-forming)/AMP-acid ligase II
VLDAAQKDGFGDLTPSDIVLTCLPLFHASGLFTSLIGLVHGAGVVILTEVSVPEIIAACRQHRVTSLGLVPAAMLPAVQHPAAALADFSALRRLLYGGSPIPASLVQQARATFPNAGLYHLYGLTEANGAGTALSPEAHAPERGKLLSCGVPYPALELRIIDDAGQTLPPHKIGEIVMRGPMVMKGYWRNPEATRAAFTADGWLRTGDAAYMDEDGYVYVHDRVKDMIVSGGENVYPAEVESALYGHPAVADVAVIGVPDARWGEAVKAVVVLKPDTEVTSEELIAYARTRIAGYKLPKSIDFVDILPRNPSGKLLKHVLRAPYWQGSDRQVG